MVLNVFLFVPCGFLYHLSDCDKILHIKLLKQEEGGTCIPKFNPLMEGEI